MKKVRLDSLLVERDLVPSREIAQRYIRAGKVLLDETVFDKPGERVAEDAVLRVQMPETPFVSRGGEKLDGALEEFGVDVCGCVAADFGASTGGFTDCLLQRGAVKVYAIDVGRGQLAYRLQTDPRVVVLDQTNCRYLTAENLGGAVDRVVADLSFIGIKTVFPAIQRVLKPEGCAVLLIKPQFEIGKGKVGKKGIVKKSEDHLDVLHSMYHFFLEQKWCVLHLAPSKIRGKTGNMEFLIHLSPEPRDSIQESDLVLAVERAHENAGSLHE